MMKWVNRVTMMRKKTQMVVMYSTWVLGVYSQYWIEDACLWYDYGDINDDNDGCGGEI